jgi:hypothetical protein
MDSSALEVVESVDHLKHGSTDAIQLAQDQFVSVFKHRQGCL